MADQVSLTVYLYNLKSFSYRDSDSRKAFLTISVVSHIVKQLLIVIGMPTIFEKGMRIHGYHSYLAIK